MYKVIIIDDEKAAIETLRRDLEVQADLEIKGTAGNGAKGKKLIMDIHPDLLFLDIELPDIQGIRLLSEIREQVLWDMKVVFYTAYDKYLLQALRESAFDYLLKPYDIEELNLIIERYRKTMASVQPLPSFASAVGTLMPGRDLFMISTVTGFRFLRLEEIGYFEYLKDKRLWQVELFNQTKLCLKKNTTTGDIISAIPTHLYKSVSRLLSTSIIWQ